MRDFASRSRLGVMSGEQNPGGLVVDDSPLVPGSLSNQVAVITGGSRGIGFAAALGLAKLGAEVILIGKNLENLTQANKKLQDQGLKSSSFVADVADSKQMDQICSEVLKNYTPTILVNSAGVMSERTTKTLRTSVDEWDRVLSINLNGVFNSIRNFAPIMVENRNGRLSMSQHVWEE